MGSLSQVRVRLTLNVDNYEVTV